MSAVDYVKDKLQNFVARLGVPERDKNASNVYTAPFLTDEEILNAYRGSWLPRKIIDIPAFDSVRSWRDWQATSPQIELIEAEEKRLGLRSKVKEAKVKARLWGGAAIFIGTGEANVASPLNVERITKGGIRYLTVLTRRQLQAGELERDPTSDRFNKPKFYTLSAGDKNQLQIDPSRLAIFEGAPLPDPELSMESYGWGDSVLLSVLNEIKNADSTAGNIASLVFEAKIDIIRIPNFMMSMGDEGYKAKLLERYVYANRAKGINGTLLLDKEEEYESKSAQFSMLPEILDRFLQIVSGAADIPLTRLLGQAPAGMNSTGEADLRNYYDRLSSMQELETTPAMATVDECLIRSALGSRDKSIHYNWTPLWLLSAKESAEIFKLKADAARVIAGSGAGSQPIIPVEALSEALINELVEDGSLSGLEAAVEAFGTLAEQEPSLEEQLAAQTLASASAAPKVTTDAAPRTLYVRRDVINSAEIVRWAKSQGFTDVVPDLHVTIAYSKIAVDWFKVGTSWAEKVEMVAGGPRQMERLGEKGEYIALLITAPDLVWRNKEIREAGASWDWPDYQPHISIQIGGNIDLTKVEPYRGKIILGPEIFEEVKE